jgi:hypothetical protein
MLTWELSRSSEEWWKAVVKVNLVIGTAQEDLAKVFMAPILAKYLMPLA